MYLININNPFIVHYDSNSCLVLFYSDEDKRYSATATKANKAWTVKRINSLSGLCTPDYVNSQENINFVSEQFNRALDELILIEDLKK